MRLKFKWIFTLVLALSMQFSFAQEKTVSGVVSDAGGPVPGANVVVKGTKNGVQTDFDGKYSIKAKAGDVLVVSYIGTTNVNVTVGASSVINVKLVSSSQSLEEVVIIGYGTQKRAKVIQASKVIDNSAMENLTVLSPQQMLQGQAAGVQVVQSSGVLGAATVVKIRGNASITAGGRPLYVIDGVPLNDLSFSNAQGGQALNPLLEINPNDIESQTVLKDASATAIYGSRGSNGVILITTKRGKKNQPAKVTFEQTLSVSRATDLLDMMDGTEYRKFKTLRGDNPINFLRNDYDWQAGVTREGVSRGTNLSIAGGSDKTTYYIGFGRSDQQGFIIGNKLTSTTGKISINSDISDKIKVGANLSYSEVDNDRVGSENSTFAPLTAAYLQSPWISPFDATGSLTRLAGFIPNVIAIEKFDTNKAKTTRAFGNVFAEIELFKDLTYKADFGVDRLLLEQKERSLNINTPGGSGYYATGIQNKYVVTNTLNYEKSINKHSFSGIVGSTYEQNDITNAAVSAINFASDLQLNVISGAEKQTTTSSTQNSRLNGYFARATYDFDSKYLFEVSGRRDGSSRFAENRKYGEFWALSGGWNIVNENFMSNLEFISDLKLRGSIGTTGNDRVGDFAFFPLYAGGVNGAYNNNPGFTNTQPENTDYRWEQSKTTNLGLDVAILNNRIRLSIDAYYKKTTDLILNIPIAGSNGFTVIAANAGSMENKGLEFDLSTLNVDTENFKWRTTFNISTNKNKVLELPGASTGADGNRFIAGTNQRAIEGYSINKFFLVRYVGVNAQTGNAEWLDINGVPTTTPRDSDRVIVGDANPDFAGGITNTFNYKNFDLNIFANFSYGNNIFVDGQRFTDNLANDFNKTSKVLDYWTTPGQNAYTPALTSTTRAIFARTSTNQLKDGSYLRINNVTLGYNLDSNIFKESNFFTSARIYVSATNLYTFKSKELAGVDPETTSTVANLGQGETFFTPPQSKNYLLGVKLTF
ncbi:TonB-linked outer membrane protein, SusC/RagA family [Flavobacterium segetis]|uniref:TonB-linked outer membrane protein, SusC/RagA family n=1 Tax=Flavobacterium segetis TaxID=271157 RepID=A0A1M5J8M8_9FLAO|nr:TonB-dependent receptor [Flavobacterium segetis]SHG36851.1 TonB-linked outer membrane protein, SusC/RagA family [Flavobacterium segetis]